MTAKLDDTAEAGLTLRLDPDTCGYWVRAAKESGDAEVSVYVAEFLREWRRRAWLRALEVLKSAGWAGSEIFAAIDVSTRCRIDTAEAEREIETVWTHISLRRWRRNVARYRRDTRALGSALYEIALELDSLDSECKSACLAMYEPTAWWSCFRRRPSTGYAKVKLLKNGSSCTSFVAVRIG